MLLNIFVTPPKNFFPLKRVVVDCCGGVICWGNACGVGALYGTAVDGEVVASRGFDIATFEMGTKHPS